MAPPLTKEQIKEFHLNRTVTGLYQHGNALMDSGHLQDAIANYELALSLKPYDVESHYHLGLLKTYTPDEPYAKMLYDMRSSGMVAKLPTELQTRFWFTLGKVNEDCGWYERAFEAYEKGNGLVKQLVTWSEPAEDEQVTQTISAFSKDWFDWMAKQIKPIDTDKTPIFVMGMPRSGTTLLEQILATVPGIYGAGELHIVSDKIIENLPNKMFIGNFPYGVLEFTPETFNKIGTEYLEEAWKPAPNAKYLVDKMPANYFYMGLIKLLLPNAKFIHPIRDPMDTCFSCYSKLFHKNNLQFSYDLKWAGNYYVRYRKMIAHWESVLPEGTLLNVKYIDLVDDTEGQAKRIMEYVGVPWDPACLDFHKNTRPVKTSSAAQVRRPIYKSSVARWERFKDHLGPLLDIVKDYR